MLDTVVITIPRGFYSIMKPYMFSPNADILQRPGNYLVKCMNNPTATDKENGIYRPRMTLMKRPTKNGTDLLPLRIEFSVAKMLHGNNIDEVVETDFKAVVKALGKAAYEMGVLIMSKEIMEASVSAFHPSKNIELTGGYTSGFVITELNKINASKRMDLNRDSFRNDGQSLQFYTNSHSLIVYDKVQDLKKPTKRAIDKDQNFLQASLFDTVATKEKREILRIEARLAKKVKLNDTLSRLGFKENPTFKDIFNKNMCQKILLDYWNGLIVGQNMFVFDVESKPDKILEKCFQSWPNIGPKEAVFLVGLRCLSREGIRKTRAIIERHATTRSWYRIAKDLPLIDEISDKTYHGWVKQINDSLNDFEPYRLSA